MAKPFSSRIAPCTHTLLVRKKELAKSTVLGPKALVQVGVDPGTGEQVVTELGATRHSMSTVVAVGPGEWDSGVFVEPDPRLKPGVEVMHNPQACFRFKDIPEMAEEGLYFMPWDQVIAILEPAEETKKAIRA